MGRLRRTSHSLAGADRARGDLFISVEDIGYCLPLVT
jgi:hypothetical protein